MVGNAMTIAPQSLAGLSLAEKRRLLARAAPGEVRAIRRGLPALPRPARAVVPPPDGPPSPAYNVCYPSRIRSPLDLPAFRRAVQKLVDRHPSLRTTFEERDGVLLQRVHEQASPAARGDRCVVVERGDAAPAAGGGGPPPV